MSMEDVSQKTCRCLRKKCAQGLIDGRKRIPMILSNLVGKVRDGDSIMLYEVYKRLYRGIFED